MNVLTQIITGICGGIIGGSVEVATAKSSTDSVCGAWPFRPLWALGGLLATSNAVANMLEYGLLESVVGALTEQWHYNSSDVVTSEAGHVCIPYLVWFSSAAAIVHAVIDSAVDGSATA